MNQLGAMKDTMALAERLNAGHEPKDHTSSTSIQHLREMYQKVLDDQTKAPPYRMSSDKLGRWLGWMQCAIHVTWPHLVTLDDFKAYNQAHATPPMPPEDGSVIIASYHATFRYKFYKPGAQKKERGRWQRLDEYGGWDNCDPPTGQWEYMT